MSKTSKIVLGVVGLFVVIALGAAATKKDDSTSISTSTTSPSVTLVPNASASSSSSSECASMLSQYTALNQRAAAVLDEVSSTPGASAALSSQIHALVVADVEAGRRLVDACPQYSYLTPTIDKLEAAE